MIDTNWHARSYHDTIVALGTDISKGLSRSEARERLTKYGANVFDQEETISIVGTILRQFKSPLVIILLIAGITTLFLVEYIDALVVFIALFINIAIGTFQEARASKAFERLSHSQERYAMVVRNGQKHRIHASRLVVGDIVEIDAGAYVPADMRLVETHELSVNEAALTGEWLSVDKDTEILPDKTVLASRANMVWMGTLIAAGRGRGVVVRTGNNTEIGQIAKSLQTTEDATTPIQKNIHTLAVFLTYFIVLIVVVIFILGLWRGEPLGEMLLLAIAVAVSVIPEGLPAAVTAVLAIGMERILERQGLVRNLLAAETLGGTTVILTDKTGTLTQAHMSIDEVYTLSESKDDDRLALGVALLASDAFVEKGENGERIVRGRPMEQAIVEAGLRMGLHEEDLEPTHRPEDFLPFESQNRFAASLRYLPEKKTHRVYFSGAPELLLDHATHILCDGVSAPFSSDDRDHFSALITQGGAMGKRFLAVGYKDVPWKSIPPIENGEDKAKALGGLVFGGLLSFTDPVREDVADAIRTAQEAGATVFMLTGDNKETARSIATQVGITTVGNPVMEGHEIQELSDDELWGRLETTRVFARVLPKQKQRLVKLFQGHGEVVAMTGDGINDAPALRSADIGIAVGTGTEVAKEASDLVLLNNSFAIIVGAIEEGRRIIDNLKKSITHLLSKSFHDVFIVVAAILVGTPLPILPVQILWTNIVQEGLLTFGFAFEPAESDVMRRDPRGGAVTTILTKDIRKLIFIAGTVTGIFSVALYFFLLFGLALPVAEIRTIMFVVLSLDGIFFTLSLKQLHQPLWKIDLASNTYLLFAMGMSLVLLVATLLIPALRTLLSLEVLLFRDVVLLAGVALFNLLTIESAKYIVFRYKKS